MGVFDCISELDVLTGRTEDVEFLTKKRTVSKDLILQYKDTFNSRTWVNLITTNKLTGDFIFENGIHLLKNVYFYDLSEFKCCNFTEEQIIFLLKNNKASVTDKFFCYMQFSEEFIRKYNCSNFRYIAQFQELSEEFIREYRTSLSNFNIHKSSIPGDLLPYFVKRSTEYEQCMHSYYDGDEDDEDKDPIIYFTSKNYTYRGYYSQCELFKD